MANIEAIKLGNGIRGVVVPIKGLNSVTVQVFFKIGGKYEMKGEFGLSHFLEHMAFKGTAKRPRAQDINKEIDSKGADWNAETGLEMTSYHITTVREHLEWAMELLADILFNSLYEETEILKERGVIMEEIRMYNDNPMMGLSGDFTKFLYGGSPRGCWDVSGNVSDIEGVTREDLIKFRNKYLNLNDVVVVVAGDVKKEDETVIKDLFEGYQNVTNNRLESVTVNLSSNKLEQRQKKIEQGHFCMGLPTISSTDERRRTLRLLDLILDGNTSSRLFSRIREERGWAYYVFSITELIKETGYWGVQSGVKADKLDEAIDLVSAEIAALPEALEETEMIRAKDYILGKMKLASDRSEYWARMIGQRLLLFEEIYDINKEIEKYKAITLKDIKELASEYFKKDEVRILSLSKE